ncbi:hypothetical protein [Falsiphaeobacter marinintestinus]|uniref:hypothetical protein n=1 Tax=Falsiphaeobacter marinintestinus TaxID=1492905 RepID=UPI0011B3FC4F|nr:hypothetical protein [Phaeobacter marinintestinus]
MTKLTLLMTASVVLLAACDFGYHRGVGFTGIDGEPSSVAQADAEQGIVSRAASSSAALASLPSIVLQADGTSVDKLAGAAISHGGRNFNDALPVKLAGQDHMLSTVQVNSVLFAVLRQPAGNPSRMGSGAGPAFLAAVPQLTGCLAASEAFASGSAENPLGLAVPLDCS